jgi:cellulose synthase operon protein C
VGLGAWGELTAGVEGIGFEFDRNLRFFTFGQGGYFSPQQFVRGGAPVGWRRDAGRLRWEFVAAPGYDWFREDGTAAFPVAPAAGGVDATATYPGQTRTGFTLDARGALAFAFTSAFDVRLAAGVQQAPEFQEVRGAVLLRFGGPSGIGLGGW